MDFFEHRYYRLVKTLMVPSGYWPYHSMGTRLSIYGFLSALFFIQIAPQILAVVKYRDERAIVIECTVTFLFEVMICTRAIGSMVNATKVKGLLNRIRTDWQVWAPEREVTILHEYAEQGRKMALMVTAQIYAIIFVYVAQPTIPKIIDVWLKNGTAPGKFPTPVDYYHIDLQKYYFYIVIYMYLCLCLGTMAFMAGDIMLIICVQHVCGIFAAVGCKLHRIGDNNTSVQSEGASYALDKRIMADLASCIDRHNDAIDFANLIESNYTWIMFCIIGCGSIMCNVIGLQILLGKSNPNETIKSICVALTLILHFYIECYTAQILLDQSMSVHLYIYDSEWYKLAPKAQNLLQLMIMRCSVPCNLTAGTFFTLSVRTFGQVLRTTMSYFAVLRSMQE